MASRGAEDLMGKDEDVVDTPYKNELSPLESKIAGIAFHIAERRLLVIVALLTLGGVAGELSHAWAAQSISLGDILMMFLYTEVLGMVAVFYTGHASTFVYPIFIAITALARLIILQGKDMKPENIVFEAVAVLLLTVAAVVIVRVGRS